MLFLFQSLGAIFLVLAILYVCDQVSGAVLRTDSSEVRWCGACVVGLWTASVAFHFLSSVGSFSITALLIIVATAITTCRMLGGSFGELWARIIHDAGRARTFFIAGWSRGEQVLLLLLLSGLLILSARVLLLPPLSHDALTYHLVKAAMWVQNGHAYLFDAPGGWTFYRCFPGVGEVLQAISLLPYHSDILLGSCDLVQLLLLLTAIFALGRSIGLSAETAFLCGLFGVTCPALWFSVGSGYVDLPLTLSMVLAVLFLVLFLESNSHGHLLFGMAALGVAGGIKYSAYLTLIAALLVVIPIFLFRSGFRLQTTSVLLLSIFLLSLPTVPWFYYNILYTGYPLSPGDLTVFGIRLGEAPPEIKWHAARAHLSMAYHLGPELRALGLAVAYPLRPPPPTFGILHLIPLLGFPWGGVGLVKRNPRLAAFFSIIIASVICFFYSPSFSFVRLGWGTCNTRFLFLAYYLALPVSFLVVSGGNWERRIRVPLLFAAALVMNVGWYGYCDPSEVPYLISCSMIIIAAALAVRWLGHVLSGKWHVLVVLTLIIAIISLVAEGRDRIRYTSAKRSYFFHGFQTYWVDAARSVDSCDRHYTIAVTSGPAQNGDNWFMYMFMGRCFQNRLLYVPISGDGRIIHFSSQFRKSVRGDFTSWIDRLKREDVTHVLSFLPGSLEFVWMKSHPESFEQISGDDRFGLFRFHNSHGLDLSD